jgi:hypothetical protein
LLLGKRRGAMRLISAVSAVADAVMMATLTSTLEIVWPMLYVRSVLLGLKRSL